MLKHSILETKGKVEDNTKECQTEIENLPDLSPTFKKGIFPWLSRKDETPGLKFGVYVNLESLNIDKEEFDHQIKDFGPEFKWLTPSDEKDIMLSPGGTNYFPEVDVGIFKIASTATPNIETIEPLTPDKNHPAIQAQGTPPRMKCVTVIFNSPEIKAMHRSKGPRHPKQNSVMGGVSANKIANLAGIVAVCQYLHLLAYQLCGNEGQHSGNLVVGTKASNTTMTLIETLIPKYINYLSKIPAKLKLEITAILKQPTHIAKEIQYNISILYPDGKEDTFPFIFNTLNPNPPHQKVQELFTKIVNRIMEMKVQSHVKELRSKRKLFFMDASENVTKKSKQSPSQVTEEENSYNIPSLI